MHAYLLYLCILQNSQHAVLIYTQTLEHTGRPVPQATTTSST